MKHKHSNKVSIWIYWEILLLCFLLVLAAISLTALGIVVVKQVTLKILLFIASSVMVTMAVIFLTFTGMQYRKLLRKYRRSAGNFNLFLVNLETGEQIPQDQLTLEQVEKVIRMLMFEGNPGKKLRLDRLLRRWDMPNVTDMRHLFVMEFYRMLVRSEDKGQYERVLQMGMPFCQEIGSFFPANCAWIADRTKTYVEAYQTDPAGASRDFGTFLEQHKEAMGQLIFQFVRDHINEYNSDNLDTV